MIQQYNNDKTNVLYDKLKFVQSLRHDEEYTKTKFKVYTTEDGDYEWLEGCAGNSGSARCAQYG